MKTNKKKYEELWINFRDLIRSITKISDDYDVKYIKGKFNLDDELPLTKKKELPSIILVFGSVFHENNKYYLQVFLNGYLYKLWIIWKCYVLKACIKIEKIIKYGDTETWKQKFHQHKRAISMKNIDINKKL